MINVIRYDIYLSSTTNLFPYYCFFVNYFFCVVMLGLKNVNLGNLSL